jgi:SWIM zinc finger
MTHGTVRLFLEINAKGKRQLYQVTPIQADSRVAPKAWRLSKGKESYDVALVTGEKGTVASCTCPDAIYRDRLCKHLLALLDGGLLP